MKTSYTQESAAPKQLEKPQGEISITPKNSPQDHEIIIRKRAGVAKSHVVVVGDIVQLDKDETLQATDGVALILIRYNTVEVDQGGREGGLSSPA